MVNLRRIALIALALILIFTGAPSKAQTVNNNQQVFKLPVQYGDTLINLFGNDWEKVYDQNCDCLFRADDEYVSSPDFLVEGAVLQISTDVYLTPRAQQRISELQQQRTALHNRLAVLENSPDEVGQSAAKLDNRLSQDVSYAGDLAYIDHSVALLEAVNQKHVAKVTTVSEEREDEIPIEIVAIAIGVLLVMLVAWLWEILHSRGTSGDSRIAAALHAIDRMAAS